MASPFVRSFVRPSTSLLFVLFQFPSSLLQWRRRRRRIRDTVMAIQIYEGQALRKRKSRRRRRSEIGPYSRAQSHHDGRWIEATPAVLPDPTTGLPAYRDTLGDCQNCHFKRGVTWVSHRANLINLRENILHKKAIPQWIWFSYH